MNSSNIKNRDTLLWRLDEVSMDGSHGERLKNVSLDIFQGITALIGPSGAGKTSLLNLLVGFEPPASGNINKTPESMPLFWVPQNNGLWHNMNVREHLAVMMKVPDDDKIEAMLKKFEIYHKETAYPAQLSKGEQARLAMARALIVPPKVLVMDEPLINLPHSMQLTLWKIVTELALDCNISLIYATHSPKYVIGTADNVVCIKDAEIIYSGSVDHLYRSPDSFELAEYLGDINWFTEENSLFLPSSEECVFPFGVRPEQIRIVKENSAPFKVVSSIFRGEVTETVIEELKSGRRNTFLHRSASVSGNGDHCRILLEKVTPEG